MFFKKYQKLTSLNTLCTPQGARVVKPLLSPITTSPRSKIFLGETLDQPPFRVHNIVLNFYKTKFDQKLDFHTMSQRSQKHHWSSNPTRCCRFSLKHDVIQNFPPLDLVSFIIYDPLKTHMKIGSTKSDILDPYV